MHAVSDYWSIVQHHYKQPLLRWCCMPGRFRRHCKYTSLPIGPSMDWWRATAHWSFRHSDMHVRKICGKDGTLADVVLNEGCKKHKHPIIHDLACAKFVCIICLRTNNCLIAAKQKSWFLTLLGHWRHSTLGQRPCGSQYLLMSSNELHRSFSSCYGASFRDKIHALCWELLCCQMILIYTKCLELWIRRSAILLIFTEVAHIHAVWHQALG